MTTAPALLLALTLCWSGTAQAQLAVAPVEPLAPAVSAATAAQALARGAMVMDIRPTADYAAGHLPGAVSVPLAGETSRQALQQLVSQHGIDLSREVVLVAQPGDPRALQLQATLAQYATGRVGWLVGGVAEWSLSGRPLATQATRLAPVPQFLVSLDSEGAAASSRMAGASVRDVHPTRAGLVASGLANTASAAGR